MKHIAVLMTCHNRKSKTLNSLECLYNVKLPEDFVLDVHLVDDGSSDGTTEEVLNKFPSVHVIAGTGSLFWNRGMHLAWENASKCKVYDYYLWLNDDTLLFRNSIIDMIDISSRYTEPNIICGATCSVKDGKFTYGGMTISGDKVIPNGNIQNCEIINGNCVLIRNDSYELIGNLDPIFPHAIGDHDYGLRLINKGGIVLSSRIFIGTCEKNDRLPSWCYANISIINRFKSLYSPLGNSHPLYYFRYENRHFGLFVAIKHLLSIHLRAIAPRLWKI